MIAFLAAGGLTGCGNDRSFSTPDISNGRVAQNGEFSAVVLLSYETEQGRAVCSGTFISPTTVLTAAHCTMGGQITNGLTGEVDLQISLIRPERNADGSLAPHILANSTAVFRHPDWDTAFEQRQVNKFDTALVEFPAGFARDTATISRREGQPGDPVTSVGYGLDYVPGLLGRSNPDASSLGVKRIGTNTLMDTGGLSVYDGMHFFQGEIDTGDASGENGNAAPGDSGGAMFNQAGELIGVTSGGGKLLTTAASIYINLHSDHSRGFLRQRGLTY